MSDRHGAIQLSREFIYCFIVANNHLLKEATMKRQQQYRELLGKGMRINDSTYLHLRSGRYSYISTLFLAVLCYYWGVGYTDMYCIGSAVKRGETPDLSRYGLDKVIEQKRAAAQAAKKRK